MRDELARAEDARGSVAAQPSALLPIEEGSVFVVAHPFCWEKASKPGGDPEGPFSVEFMSWRPGIIAEPTYGGGSEEIAHAVGHQILTVVSVHKPGKYPARVFYTRKWRDPRGREFGKGALRIKALNAFRTLTNGYRYEYELREPEQAGP